MSHVRSITVVSHVPFCSSCDHNKYLLGYLSHLGQLRSAEPELKRAADSDSDSDSEDGVTLAAAADSDSDGGADAMVVIRST